MPNFTWAEWLSIASFVVALAALFINFSKFFIELHDRKEKRKKEEKDSEEKLKAKFVVHSLNNQIIIENVSDVDANIKEIYIDGTPWNDSGYFTIDRPSLITAKQTKIIKVHSSKIQPSPSGMIIEFADPYSRKYEPSTRKQEFEI